jgi:hypothetical protein
MALNGSWFVKKAKAKGRIQVTGCKLQVKKIPKGLTLNNPVRSAGVGYPPISQP